MSIESNASLVAARLRAFDTTKTIVEWIDSISPAVDEALRKEAPRGAKDRGPHLQDRIFSERHSAIGSVQAIFETDRVPVADFVLGGTKPHDIPGAFGYPLPFGIGGRFEGKFHPGTVPNRFNVRAWLGVEAPVAESLVRRLEASLG
jgi:hypothetical protein